MARDTPLVSQRTPRALSLAFAPSLALARAFAFALAFAPAFSFSLSLAPPPIGIHYDGPVFFLSSEGFCGHFDKVGMCPSYRKS